MRMTNVGAISLAALAAPLTCIGAALPRTTGDHNASKIHPIVSARVIESAGHISGLEAGSMHLPGRARSMMNTTSAVVTRSPELHTTRAFFRPSSKAVPQMLALELTLSKTFNYRAKISVGIPGNEFDVIPDTGTTDFWLMASDLPRRASGGNVYSPGKSASPVNKKYKSEYSGDSAGRNLGEWYTDTVTMKNTVVSNVALVAVTLWTSTFGSQSPFTADGVLGLGLPQSGSKHFIKYLTDARLIPEAMFAFRFIDPNWPTSWHGRDATSILTLGGADPQYYDGDITKLKVVSKRFWTVQADSVVMSAEDPASIAQTQSSSSWQVLGRREMWIDTGADMITGPTADVRILHSFIPGAQLVGTGANGQTYYKFPVVSVVIVTITFAGQPFTVPVNQLAIGRSGDYYSSGIAGLDTVGLPPWTLGTIFLRNFYTVFILPRTLRSAQVGFARLRLRTPNQWGYQ